MAAQLDGSGARKGEVGFFLLATLGLRQSARVRPYPCHSAVVSQRPFAVLRHLYVIPEEQRVQEQPVGAAPVPAEVRVVHEEHNGASPEPVD